MGSQTSDPGVVVTELFNSRRQVDTIDGTVVRNYFVNGDPAQTIVTAANVFQVTGEELPKRGDRFDDGVRPPIQQLICDSLEIVGVVPNGVFVDVTYKQVTWGSFNLYQLQDPDNPDSFPALLGTQQIQSQSFGVPRVHKRFMPGSDGQYPIYEVSTETQIRQSEILTIQLHLPEITSNIRSQIRSRIGQVHLDLSSPSYNDAPNFDQGEQNYAAIFLGADNEFLGQSLVRFQYRWNLQGWFPKLPERSNFGAGVTNPPTVIETIPVEPHSSLSLIRQNPEATGVAVEQDPLYYNSTPINSRPTGTAGALPGLENVDVVGIFGALPI